MKRPVEEGLDERYGAAVERQPPGREAVSLGGSGRTGLPPALEADTVASRIAWIPDACGDGLRLPPRDPFQRRFNDGPFDGRMVSSQWLRFNCTIRRLNGDNLMVPLDGFMVSI